MNQRLDSHPKLLLEHRKSMAQVAKGAVAALAFGLGFFLSSAIGLVIYYRVTIEAWEIAIFALGGGTLGALVLYYALAHLRAGGEFLCRLDEKQFTCVSPVDNCGDSFDLPLGEIVKIEREDWGGDDCRWYVWDTKGKRHWISSNYENPVEKYITLLERLRAGIERIDTK